MSQRVPTVICLLPSDLCLLTSDLCLRIFTLVESALQIRPFLTNKANFRESQMNVNLYNTMAYENKWQRRVRKNKANSKPNKANLRKAQMNVNSLITKDYRKKDDFTVRKNKPKTNPIRTQSNPISNGAGRSIFSKKGLTVCVVSCYITTS